MGLRMPGPDGVRSRMEAVASRRSAGRGTAGERTILVGTDGSDGADLAIEHAVAVASALRWSVVVAVVHSTEDRGIRGDGRRSIGLARRQSGAAAMPISRHGAELDPGAGEPPSERTLRGVAVPGPVPKALLTLAQDEGCDLVVVGNRRDAARPAGGLAATLAAEAPCDVLVVDTIDRRRPGYRRIGAAGVDIGGSLAELVRGVRPASTGCRARRADGGPPRSGLLAPALTCQNHSRTTCSSSIATALGPGERSGV